MSGKIWFAAALIIGGINASGAMAQSSQSSQSTQATSPGQSGASSTIPQPPSGGRATGNSASGPQTDQERQADTQAKKATGQVCRGC